MKTVMRISIIVLLFCAETGELLAQSIGGGWAKNVQRLEKTSFGGAIGGTADVWGWRDNRTAKDYALMASGGAGLLIAETTNPMLIEKKYHVKDTTNNPLVPKSWADVETYTASNGQTYAYAAKAATVGVIAVDDTNFAEIRSANPFVIIVNLTQAVDNPGEVIVTPDSNVTPNPNNIYCGKINSYIPYERIVRGTTSHVTEAHTLNIAGGILYVCTLADVVLAYDLRVSPTNPPLIGVLYIYGNLGFPVSQLVQRPALIHGQIGVHELFARSTGSNTARLYIGATRGGALQIIDI